jgi:hypothetical protein
MSYWPNFYKAFERYEFFLNCHLDALVLKRAFPRSRVVSWPLERWRESENPGPWATTMICSGHSPRAGISHRLRVATVEDALQFSFETCPRKCFEMNGRRLPFGCHAWEYDRAFWEPHLLTGRVSPGVGSGSSSGWTVFTSGSFLSVDDRRAARLYPASKAY